MISRKLKNRHSNKANSTIDSQPGQNVVNYPPSSYFNIDYMWLSIEPDFNTKRINCKQQLKLTTLQDLEKIELDCVYNDKQKIEIHSPLLYSDAASKQGDKQLLFKQNNDKLSIDIGKSKEGSKFSLVIDYSTKGNVLPANDASSDGMGFNFIEIGDHVAFQCWTQGEPTASKKWFPCIDHPQAKFPRQISVIVPENIAKAEGPKTKFVVISNGEIDIIDQEDEQGRKKKYVWEEPHPDTAYLTSIVIGTFAELPEENYDGRVPLLYYVPPGRDEEGRWLFKNTLRMMSFFEAYFGTKYQYDKYSQVTVEEFPFGGMENTSCTTLTTRYLPDEKTARDSNTYDYVVVHELAHQWFGDLVTCRDWQHIWLNEAFASYSEALYYENILGEEEYSSYMLANADGYLNSTAEGVHTIPLVYKNYENPLDMFSTPRTYQKGACILHMLRSLIGDNDFRKSIQTYLDLFKNKTAETDDMRKIFEQNSGKSLQEFFDQWMYQGGHPELNVIVSVTNSTVNVKVQQTQVNLFRFPLDVMIVFLMSDGTEKKIEDTFFIEDKKEVEKTYNIPNGASVKRVPIDPYFKILKKLNLIVQDTDNAILLNSLIDGETVIEKINAAKALTGKQSTTDLVSPLKNVILQENLFWGVRAEAAKTLGSVRSEASYEALKQCYERVQNNNNDNKIKESIVEALGSFSKADSFDLLKPILENDNESANVQYAAAIAIAKSGSEENTIPLLTALLDRKSYKNIVARGAVEGLKIVSLETSKKETIDTLESILIEKSKRGTDDRIRQAAISALGYLTRYNKDRSHIVTHLKGLLNDGSIHIRNTAYASLGNAFRYTQDGQMAQDLKVAILNEASEFVKQTAKRSIDLLEKSPPPSHQLASEKSSLKSTNYKIKTIQDMEERIVKF
jgi:aminopeptidase N